jgi:membrane peptidoglycan carboxypeptidase
MEWRFRGKQKACRGAFLISSFLLIASLPVSLLLVVSLIILQSELESIAAPFDFSKLDRVRSASVVYDRNGKVIGRFLTENRTVVAYSAISPLLVKAVIAEEE